MSGFDVAKAEAFAERFLAALNHGALGLMISIGHRTGLFDALSRMPVEDEIVECLYRGGGVGYEKYQRFHEVMAEDSGQTTFDAIHDQSQPMNVLRGIHRSLKPDGVYLMQDIKGSSDVSNNLDHPIGAFLYAISCMHCMTVSLAQGGEGLGAMWGQEKTVEYLHRAGFATVEVNELAHNIPNN